MKFAKHISHKNFLLYGTCICVFYNQLLCCYLVRLRPCLSWQNGHCRCLVSHSQTLSLESLATCDQLMSCVSCLARSSLALGQLTLQAHTLISAKYMQCRRQLFSLVTNQSSFIGERRFFLVSRAIGVAFIRGQHLME